MSYRHASAWTKRSARAGNIAAQASLASRGISWRRGTSSARRSIPSAHRRAINTAYMIQRGKLSYGQLTPEQRRDVAKHFADLPLSIQRAYRASKGEYTVQTAAKGVLKYTPLGFGLFAAEKIVKKGKEWGEWKPEAEREFEERQKATKEATKHWERTPEGSLITPTKLSREAQAWSSTIQKHQTDLERLQSDAAKRGWVYGEVTTGEESIYLPDTQEGRAWAREYDVAIGAYQETIRKKDKFLTEEGHYKPEHVKLTKEAKEVSEEMEWLELRAEQVSSPLFMAKERTEGMRIAPMVTKAYEFGDWWGEKVSTPFEKATKKYPRVVTALGIAPMPIVTVPRYMAKKGFEHFAPETLKPHIKKMPLGITDLPISFKVGMVKGIPDVPIMAAEIGYAGEWIGRHPKEAAIIAPGVAAYMAKGMAKEAVAHPVEFTGRMMTMAIVTGGMGKAVRPVMPKYISGVKVTDVGRITYKGIGIKGMKEPHPMVGMWKETVRTPDIVAMQRAFVLGKEYPALRYLKGVREAEFPTPELGIGARAFGKQIYTEIGVGRAIKYERMRIEGLWGKDYFLPERIAGVPEPVGMPTFKALPPPKPVLWERVGPTTLAERVTALMKTKQPKPIKEWGIRIEKPTIPTYTELARGRAYRIIKGYDAFQMGQYPAHLKILGLGKGVAEFGKVREISIHPFRRKVPSVYEPSMLDYRVPKGLLTEGGVLDISRAKIRQTERPPSPIEKLYERVTAEDIFREFGIERRPVIGVKEVLKPIETRYLKFTPEGELIPQPEISIRKPKRKIEVATMPKISWGFEVITDKAIKPMTDTRISTKTVMEKTAEEMKRARELTKVGISKTRAFGKIPLSKRIVVGLPIMGAVPTYIPERVEKEKTFGFLIPGYEAAFKPSPVEAIIPKEKPKEKEKTFAFIMPKIKPAVEVKFAEEPKVEPITEFGYGPAKPPPSFPPYFTEPPQKPFAFVWGGEEKPRKKKKYKRKPFFWQVRNPIPDLGRMLQTDVNKINREMAMAMTTKRKRVVKRERKKKK